MSFSAPSARGAALLALAAALSAAAACAEAGGGRARPNVLLIVVDTLRADRLGCYGCERDTSPEIDALAAAGARFTTAVSTAPWTLPSVATILSGLYPSAHTVIRPESVLPDGVTTLAERFSAAGYGTGGVTSNPLLQEKSGFAQGYHAYRRGHAKGHGYASSAGITDDALAVMDAARADGKPFFVSALYFDPHYTYRPHDEVDFAPAGAGRLRGGESVQVLRAMEPALTADEVALVRDLYDEEVRHTDREIGRLLAGLRERGLEGSTVVVLTADHGEELNERGWFGHTRSLHVELLHVPLVIRDPRRPGGCVVERPVSLVSLAPTVLELAGLPLHDELHGPSLVPLLDQRALELPPIYSEVDFVPLGKRHSDKEAHQRAVVVGGHKLVVDDATGARALYDLVRDPRELRNLAGESPERVTELELVLEECARRAATGAASASEVERTDDELEALRGLGYAE